MKTKITLWVGSILGGALMVYLLSAFGGPALGVLRQSTSVIGVLFFLAALSATILCLSWRWGYLIRGLVPSSSLAMLTLMRSAGHSLAVLIPSGKLGGDPLRAWLATRQAVPAAESVASVAADRTLETLSSAPFSVLFALLLLQHGVPELDRALITIVIGIVIFVVLVVVASRALLNGRGIVSELVRRIVSDASSRRSFRIGLIEDAEAAATRLLDQRSRLAAAFGVGLIANGLVIVEFWALLTAFGLPHDLIAVVAAIFATGAAHTLPIPAGVGVLEGAQIWIFGILGYPMEVGFAVGLAVRLRDVLWMLPGVAYMIFGALRASVSETSKA